MARIELPFGRGKLRADIPDRRLAGVLRSKAQDMEKQVAARLRAAFAEGKPEA